MDISFWAIGAGVCLIIAIVIALTRDVEELPDADEDNPRRSP